jgi:hypothetical protein
LPWPDVLTSIKDVLSFTDVGSSTRRRVTG